MQAKSSCVGASDIDWLLVGVLRDGVSYRILHRRLTASGISVALNGSKGCGCGQMGTAVAKYRSRQTESTNITREEEEEERREKQKRGEERRRGDSGWLVSGTAVGPPQSREWRWEARGGARWMKIAQERCVVCKQTLL